MSRSLPIVALLLFLPLWLAASYGVRYGLMEDAQWVGLCAAPGAFWQCQVRSLLGLGIHFQVIAWSGLGLALVLYTASIAVFAVVLAGLRLVRQPR